MTNRKYIIDALAGEFGEEAYEDVVALLDCPSDGGCSAWSVIDGTCLKCIKEWLDKEVGE